MALSKYERKERLGYGAQKEIAQELGRGFSEATVSRVMNEKDGSTVTPEKARRVRVAIARRLRMPVDEAFPAASD